MQVRARAVAGVHQPPLYQGIEGSRVSLIAIVLEEGAMIPGQTKHLEVALHRIDEFRFRSFAIQILDAQHDLAALGLRDKPGHKCSVDISRMHAPGRRWGESPDDLLAHSAYPFFP